MACFNLCWSFLASGNLQPKYLSSGQMFANLNGSRKTRIIKWLSLSLALRLQHCSIQSSFRCQIYVQQMESLKNDRINFNFVALKIGQMEGPIILSWHRCMAGDLLRNKRMFFYEQMPDSNDYDYDDELCKFYVRFRARKMCNFTFDSEKWQWKPPSITWCVFSFELIFKYRKGATNREPTNNKSSTFFQPKSQAAKSKWAKIETGLSLGNRWEM